MKNLVYQSMIFYLTDAVTKSSKVMKKCSKELKVNNK